ncbi:hypothetical protein VSDG_00286 [Cytospora chrysosperma]|uniref:Serine hydrolase domain-containing protein n=1 Tax=Cytospora chrysosperma TaxID=252740 RepID=A0A423WQ22_CYTCH|nr:hypothetical protein VSDG_00286 [Valsa sordida]
MPKILCLHGQGTSGSIFKSQSASFRAKLPPDFEWDFPDAPYSAKAHPGIDILFNSPTYAWWLASQDTVNAVRAAHLWLDEYIQEHGPYDGVCCFSQGCSLAGSYLLYHAKEDPGKQLPFRWAIFICGGLPLPVLEDLGLEVPQRAHELNERTVTLMRAKSAMLYDIEKLPKGQGLWDNTADLEHDADELPDETDCFGLDFTKFPKNLRIKIPTVHIVGEKDPRWSAGVQLAYFCDDGKFYDHRGGHDIPRTTPVSLRIAELVKEVSES